MPHHDVSRTEIALAPPFLFAEIKTPQKHDRIKQHKEENDNAIPKECAATFHMNGEGQPVNLRVRARLDSEKIFSGRDCRKRYARLLTSLGP